MIGDLKRAAQTSAIYAIGNLLVKVAGLILIPIYLGSLTPAEYGELVILEVLAQLCIGVIAFNLPVAFLRFGSETTDRRERGSLYFTALVLLWGICGIFLMLSLPVAPWLAGALLESEQGGLFLTLLFLDVAIEVPGLLPLQWLRLRERPGAYMAFFVLKVVGMLGFVVYFVAYRQMGVMGAMWGILCGNALLLLATLPVQWRVAVAKFHREGAARMLRYGTPLILTTISVVLLTTADRYILLHYRGSSEVGFYGLAFKLGSLINLLLINSFMLGFSPIAFRKYGESGFSRFFTKMQVYFLGVAVVLTLGISVFSLECIELLQPEGGDYAMAAALVPVIAFTFLFKALQYFMSLVFHLTKRTRYDAVITTAGVLLNIGVNFLLIPRFGMYGAAIGTGVSFMAMVTLSHHYAQRQHRMPYEYRRLVLLIATCALWMGAAQWLNAMDVLFRIAAKISLLALYAALLYYVIADQAERAKVSKVYALLRGPGGVKAVMREVFHFR
jgi:O-antigen/teichoic acid export membrane protein